MSIPNFDRNLLSKRPPRYNRGFDTKPIEGISAPVSIGLYTIDSAILKYLQEKIKPIVTQDGRQIQVPVIYGNPERWKSVQQDGALRDKNGKVMLPIMMILRTGMQKNELFSPVNKYQRYVFKSGWNPRNIYDKFAALNNITPSEAYYSSVVPDHYNITYNVVAWTEYMEQMNRLVENISFESYEYWGEVNNYKFMAKIDSFDQQTDLPTASDRIVRNKFSIDVRAYILPESALDRSGNRAATTRLDFSPKKVVFSTEVVTNL
jgi:hypothetical protein